MQSRVPGPLDEVRQMVDQVESVERVASDLSNRPHHYEQDHTLLVLNLSMRFKRKKTIFKMEQPI